MDNKHTVRSYDQDLNFLVSNIAEMGGHAERMIERAVKALIKGDSKLAQEVIAEDKMLDNAQRSIEDKAIMTIAKRQPMAIDLREIVGTMRISNDIERIGDMAKNIAKRSFAVAEGRHPGKLHRSIEALAELALTQLKDVLDVYASRSVERLAAVRDRDEEIDALYTSLFRELLTYMMEDPRNITGCTHLLFCAKNLERVGDHATNIAETVFYIVTGNQMAVDRPTEDASHEITMEPEK
ncbi:MAG: phosphate signaling complex protein PhoU [Rhizobiaceae bacterium]